MPDDDMPDNDVCWHPNSFCLQVVFFLLDIEDSFDYDVIVR